MHRAAPTLTRGLVVLTILGGTSALRIGSARAIPTRNPRSSRGPLVLSTLIHRLVVRAAGNADRVPQGTAVALAGHPGVVALADALEGHRLKMPNVKQMGGTGSAATATIDYHGGTVRLEAIARPTPAGDAPTPADFLVSCRVTHGRGLPVSAADRSTGQSVLLLDGAGGRATRVAVFAAPGEKGDPLDTVRSSIARALAATPEELSLHAAFSAMAAALRKPRVGETGRFWLFQSLPGERDTRWAIEETLTGTAPPCHLPKILQRVLHEQWNARPAQGRPNDNVVLVVPEPDENPYEFPFDVELKGTLAAKARKLIVPSTGVGPCAARLVDLFTDPVLVWVAKPGRTK